MQPLIVDFPALKEKTRIYLGPESWVDLFPLPPEIRAHERDLAREMADAAPGKVVLLGRECVMHRTQKVYGRDYTYAGADHPISPTPPCVAAILAWANTLEYGTGFNGVLANKYVGGDETIGMHRDATNTLVCDTRGATEIMGVNFGVARTLHFRPIKAGTFGRPKKPGERVATNGAANVVMHAGTGYVMGGMTQMTHKHGIPREAKIDGTRISLTLRKFI